MDFDLFARLHSEGCTDGEIAKAAATHHVVVRYWRNRVKLKANAPRPKPAPIVGVKTWTPERDELISKLWEEGKSASEIAHEVGHSVSRNAVIGRIHRLGLSRRRANYILRPAPKRQRPATTRPLEPKPFKMSKPSAVRQLLRELPTEPLPAQDATAATVSFNDLEAHHCRAITVEHLPFDGDAKIYCGQRKTPGSSYCECHTRRYMTPIAVVSAKQPDRPSWQDNRAGRKGAVFLGGREKMKAY